MTISALNQIEKQEPTKYFNLCEYGKIIRATKKDILSFAQKILLLSIADHFGKNGKVFPSNQALADETGLQVESVMNHLSYLKNKRYIHYEKQHNKKRRYIKLFDPITGAIFLPRLSLVSDSGLTGELESIIKKRSLGKETTTGPPPKIPEPKTEIPLPEPRPIPVVALSQNLRAKIEPAKRITVSLPTIERCLEKYSEGQVQTLIAQVNDPARHITNAGSYLNSAAKAGDWVLEDRIESERKEKQEKADLIEKEKSEQAAISEQRERVLQEKQDVLQSIPSFTDQEKADLIRKFAFTKPPAMIKKWCAKSWDELINIISFQEFVLKEIQKK